MTTELSASLATAADEIEKILEIVRARDERAEKGAGEMFHSEYTDIGKSAASALQAIRKVHGLAAAQ